MKKINSVLLSFTTAALSQQPQTDIQSQIYKGAFGAITDEKIINDIIYKDVTFSNIPYSLDYEAQTNFLNTITQKIKSGKGKFKLQQSQEEQKIYTCENRRPADAYEMFSFLPVYDGSIKQSEPKIKFRGHCMDYNITYEHLNSNKFNLLVTSSNRKSITCLENLFFANTEIKHVETLYFERDHVISINIPHKGNIDFDFGGLKVYHFCYGMYGEIEGMFRTFEAFIGGISADLPLIPIIGSKTPWYMERANLDFLEAGMGLIYQERPIYNVEIPEKLIHSGDFLLMTRLDGVDPMIMYATGAHGAHSAVAVRFDGELYIVEVQNGWYWPVEGIQRTPYQEWLIHAKNASFNVVWLPLRPDLREKFDVNAVINEFKATEGLPLGYHNILFSLIDTVRDNFPPTFPNELIPIVFSIAEIFMSKEINDIFVQALNKRLGTNCKDVPCLANNAALQMMTLQEVMAMPEQDGWIYKGFKKDGLSFICSAYVVHLYKIGGLFDDIEVNATEFHSRDVYMLDFFDKQFQRPQNCIDADPTLPYCQLFGQYRVDITNEWSTVTPYDHMNERCPTVAPDYFRPNGC